MSIGLLIDEECNYGGPMASSAIKQFVSEVLGWTGLSRCRYATAPGDIHLTLMQTVRLRDHCYLPPQKCFGDAKKRLQSLDKHRCRCRCGLVENTSYLHQKNYI
jgi:Mrp family chromosome partitioning ATPase